MKSTFELQAVRPKRRRRISNTGMKALWQKQLSAGGQVEYVPAVIRELKVHGLKSERVWLCDVHAAEVDALMDARTQYEDALGIYRWMYLNLPHGTFTQLRKLITEHKMK